ncbi:MAG: hypothetical protein ACYTGC_06900, partial [Planctomycetota bacterium]
MRHGFFAGTTVLLIWSGVAVAQSPPGCNTSAAGVSLTAEVGGQSFPSDTCVIPGQEVQYRTAPFVPPNDLANNPLRVFCDLQNGQLSVTLPSWNVMPLRPGQYVPTAGYPFTPIMEIPQFGNTMPLGLINVPATYIVEADHAVDDLLLARADYGQTSFVNTIGETQANGIVLSAPQEQTASASVTFALPLCRPAVDLSVSADPDAFCMGSTETVTFTYFVTNSSTARGGLPAGDLTDIILIDPACGDIMGPVGDDGDGLLNAGETWQYMCTRDVSSTLMSTPTVTAHAIALFPVGQVVDTVDYTASASATVTALPGPLTSIDPPQAQACGGASVQFCAVVDGAVPPLQYAWTGPGGFTAATQCISVGVAGSYCV